MSRCAVVLLAAALVAAGCTSEPDAARRPRPGPDDVPEFSLDPSPSGSHSPKLTVRLVRDVRPDDLRVRTAVDAVHHLAGTIGPRHATSPEFREAADWVAGSSGLRPAGAPPDVPGPRRRLLGRAGRPGRSANVIAATFDYEPTKPHVVVGAHLDTVPAGAGRRGQRVRRRHAARGRAGAAAPAGRAAGAADRVRGRGAARPERRRPPLRIRAYVASLTPAERRAVRGMLSLDRVGVGSRRPRRCAPRAAGRPGPRRRPGRRAGGAGDRPAVQRPLVVRAGRPPGAARRQHAVRRVPQRRRRPVRRRPRPAERTGRLVLSWLSG